MKIFNVFFMVFLLCNVQAHVCLILKTDDGTVDGNPGGPC
jgi:hypothetical protein